ncbi:MAG: hypothetical protein WHV44_15435 [Anaerolineales bacterium]
MLKKLLFNRYTLVGLLVFMLMVGVSVFSLDVPLGDAMLYSFILTVVGMAVTWWQYG